MKPHPEQRLSIHMNIRHVIIGMLTWIVALTAGWAVLRSELSDQSSSVADLSTDVQRWLTGRNHKMHVTAPDRIVVALGDPVFLQDEDGAWHQVGTTVNVNGTADRDPVITQECDVLIYDHAREKFPNGFRLDFHTTPMSLDWVAKTMIPPHRQKEIGKLIMAEWVEQQEEITTKLRPVLRDGVRTAMKAVEDELPGILRSHREDFRALGDKYESEILKAEVIPLVKSEILPIIEEEAVPVAEEVGRALWKRVSLWSFTWRFIYDKSPLPKRNAVKAEFQRFVEQEALPELRSRTDQFIETTETIVKRAMENPEVKAVLKENFQRVVKDDELHKIVWNIVREAVIDNQTLRRELDAYLDSHETKAAMELAGDRLEPLVREIGDMIFGSREKGITPEFSRILRSQILTKDRRWFVMSPLETENPGESDGITAVWADEPMMYPMGFGGEAQSPLTPMK